MPSLISYGPGATFCLNLDQMLFWSLGIGATQDRLDQTFQLALQVNYPPTVAGVDPSLFRGVLARVDVKMALTLQSLQKVADVALRSGNLVTDTERTVEAFQLFKNQDKVRPTAVDEVTEEAKALVRGYWDIRGWLDEVNPQVQSLVLGAYRIKYTP